MNVRPPSLTETTTSVLRAGGSGQDRLPRSVASPTTWTARASARNGKKLWPAPTRQNGFPFCRHGKATDETTLAKLFGPWE